MKFRDKLFEDMPVEESPPSRGAWIEISLHILREKRLAVAPLAGGVD